MNGKMNTVSGEISPYASNSSSVTELEIIPQKSEELTSKQKRSIVFGILGFILLCILIGTSVYYLMLPSTNTERIKDVVIIFLAILSLLASITFVVMLVQVARFVNLLQNEIRPIVESTNETISNLRGTTEFLGDHVAQPVITIAQYAAALRRFLELINLVKKSPKT